MTRILTVILLFLLPFSLHAQQKRIYRLPDNITTSDYSGEYIIVKIKSSGSAAINGKSTANTILQRIDKIKSIERALPHLKDQGKSNSRAASHPLSNIYKLEISEGNPIDVINELLLYNEIEYAEPYFNNPTLFVPDDPQAAVGSGLQTYLGVIKAYDAWTIEKGDENIIIGILDTGADLNHPDLANNVYINSDDPINGLDDDNDGLIDNFKGWDIANNDNNVTPDTDPHGTQVTGVSSASTNNGYGIAGTGFRSRFMPIKIFQSGTNFNVGGYEAIALAADLGCKVINLSWGSPGSFTQFGQDIINYAVLEKDAAVVAAAGNTNGLLDFYPASFDNVLSVGATNINDTKASFATYSHKIDLMAPGNSIYTVTNDSAFSTHSGTSFSSPLTAGALALVRARFPNLTAQQAMERIRVHSKDIYGVSGNENFDGLLGKGRLDMLNALTANSPSVRIEAVNYSNGKGEYAFFGDTLSIKICLKNFLSSTIDGNAVLTSNSSHVTVLDSLFTFGVLNTLDTVSNYSNTFKIVLSDDLPLEQDLVFRLDFEDGAYDDFEYFKIKSSPDYITLDNGKLAMTINSYGDLGYNIDGFQQGVGLTYNQKNILDNIGFITATSADSVQDNAPNNLTLNFRDHDFNKLSNIKFYQNSIAPIDLRTSYEASQTNLGINVDQKLLAFDDPAYNDFIILEYRLINDTGVQIDSIYTGLFADWNLNDKDRNTALWDASNKLGYVKDNQTDTLYSGIAILIDGDSIYFPINNRNFNGNLADIGSEINNQTKFNLISQSIKKTLAGDKGGGNDVSHLVGFTIAQLDPDQTTKVAFALVAGNSLAELQSAAQNARSKYEEYLSNPPLIAQSETCPGTTTTINPSNGTNFEFYDSPELTNLLYTGETFTTPVVNSELTYYVVNIDKAIKGDVFSVKATPKPVNTDFEFSANPLLLDETGQTEVIFTDTSIDAVSWSWDFGNGFNTNVQNPKMNFTQIGNYTVELNVQSDIGCLGSITKNLEVAYRSNKPDINSQEICSGDAVSLSAGNATNLNVYDSENLINLIFSGTSFNPGNIANDTTYYITSMDSTYESNPQRVDINVSKVNADFELQIDTLDLNNKHLLHLNSTSSNAVQYFWIIDNVLMGNSTDITFNYDDISSFEIKLVAEDAIGCKDTITQIVTPTESLIPEANNTEVCSGDTVILSPDNGDFFYFYNDQNLTEIIHKGKQLTFDSLVNDTTIFITGIDNLLESDPLQVSINVSDIKADFSIPSTLDINTTNILSPVNLSTDDDSWEWHINDVLTSTVKSPDFEFTQTGIFNIKLIVGNSIGCTDSTNLELIVDAITSTTPQIQEISIYPNPVKQTLLIGVPTGIQNWSVEVLSLHGVALIKAENIDSIDLSGLPNGIYIVRILNDDSIFQKQIIKTD